VLNKKVYIRAIVLFFCLQCSHKQVYFWSEYSVKYVGNEQELNKTLNDLKTKHYEYRIFNYDNVYEIQYRKEIKK
jgi:hypothetical protein